MGFANVGHGSELRIDSGFRSGRRQPNATDQLPRQVSGHLRGYDYLAEFYGNSISGAVQSLAICCR